MLSLSVREIFLKNFYAKKIGNICEHIKISKNNIATFFTKLFNFRKRTTRQQIMNRVESITDLEKEVLVLDSEGLPVGKARKVVFSIVNLKKEKTDETETEDKDNNRRRTSRSSFKKQEENNFSANLDFNSEAGEASFTNISARNYKSRDDQHAGNTINANFQHAGASILSGHEDKKKSGDKKRTKEDNNANKETGGTTRNRNIDLEHIHYQRKNTTDNLTINNNLRHLQKILLRAGDIEKNPGPGPTRIPEPMIMEELKLSATLELPEKELYNIEYFNFEEFLLTPRGIISIKEKLHNHIYSCPPCNTLNNCFKKFMKIYIKKPIPLSNAMITIIVECLQCIRCAYCLNLTKYKPNKFLPMGFICSQDCEGKYMNEFICNYSETERSIVFHPEHRTRALWIKHLGLKTMNNIGRVPTCGEHFTYRTCITDCFNVRAIKEWIEDPENNLKERKKRAKKRTVPNPDPNQIIELILNLAGGAACAGEKCGKNLWLYKGESEYDNKTGLQYCSYSCSKSRKKKKINCHEEKVQIIQSCIAETYHLNQRNLYQEPRAGGSSLLNQLSTYVANNQSSPTLEKITGRILEGTAKITTWNMQGATNIDQAIQFLNKSKPAILCLQEARLNEDNHHKFQNKHYKSFQDRDKGDLVTFIRKDVKAQLINDNLLQDISYMIIEVQTEGEKIHIANLYARDGKLHYKQLRYLTEKYRNIIILGDLNAKQDELLPHTQKTRYNSNGLQLKSFLEGKDSLNSSQANVSVHNINDISEWTHTTHDGKWAQIDYIISHLSITHKITDTQYEYNLVSDHQGISVKAPELFPETHTLSKNKFVLDWRTYDMWRYKYLTEIELDAAVITGNWYEQPLHKKIEVFTNAQKLAFHNSIQYKQISNRGGTKPRWLIQLIQTKRRYQNGLRKLASDTRKKREEAINTILNIPNTEIKFHYDQETFDYWEKNQKNFRTEIHRMARKINRSIIKINQENWEKELQKLGETDINKAPREFYSTMKRLSGAGRSNNGIRKMEYNGLSANTEEGIANLMAQHAQDSFKPLEDPDFNYFYFQTITEEWNSAQEALDQARGETIHKEYDEEDNFTWNPKSANVNNKTLKETEQENYNPNATKHQAKTWEVVNDKSYKKIKEPLPQAPRLNMQVNEQWNENTAHSCKKGKEELEKVYNDFGSNDLNKVINKMKRKAPGNDELVIDQFRDLGHGGKLKLLEIANEIYQTGVFPEPWKQAIVVPILKKDKTAKDPASYRPISLLPVGAKIVESLVLTRINPYLNKRGLIPVIQTGFRKGQSTSLNLKRMYSHSYTRSIRSTHPTSSTMVFFDAKKAFDSVWHVGLLHKAMRDGLPGIIIRFFRSWLQDRTMRIRIGTTLSNQIKMESGVPQGSVLAPEAWNYNTGDIPTTKSAHSDTAVYADDTSSATSHMNIETLIELAQEEIWQLSDWTKEKRIKFEPSKTHVLAISRKPDTRREIQKNTLYLDRNKKDALKYTNHAKLLGVTFSDTGTFHKHINDKLKICYGRIKQLYRFAKHVKGDTLYKVFLTSIEPIITYATEVLYENMSCNTIKKLNALEFTAIKTCYGLNRQTPTIDCLEYLKNGGIADRLEKRRNNFIENNKDSILIKHAETLKYSEGRRIRTKITHRDRSLRKKGWKSNLHLHKEHPFFSNIAKINTQDMDEDNDNNTSQDNAKRNINIMQRDPAFQEGNIANTPIRFPEQEINRVRFRCRPGHERGSQFDPG